MSEQPTTVDALYLNAEHFALIAASQPPSEPRARVVPVGRAFPGLGLDGAGVGVVRPDEEPTP